ncbi:acetoin utilization protein AcuB [Desulfocicer vacuolatum DSM 3385]|uniref:Acetoin utilization protein AcuB n=1 Tax=Desulfocicer vacuolatum DSM 3385 TaxID=1121400 RepID=A0A1W2DPW1_9BACT|nr:CBS and ACT domain-containing protein [Desulfocicer vacuolatum]SMC99500.1 acetoin utilization protein AcuB [Desulfocicer vacuolatum DSM 3385]
MLVKKWMSSPVNTVEANASLMDAADLFEKKVISMLPVMEKGRIVGIVTDGDIKKATPSQATTLAVYELGDLLRKVKITKMMSSPVLSTTEDCTVEEAARKMLMENISGMPVKNNQGHLTGIITKSDIFRSLVSFTGAAQKGQIFALKINDSPGSVKNLIDIIRMGGGRLLSILTSYDDVEQGFRKVFVHAFNLPEENFDGVVSQLYDAGELLFLADQTRNIRKIFGGFYEKN